MQRTRLGQLLVAGGLVVATVSALGLVFGAVASSTSVAVDAASRLVEVDVIREPIEAELARAVVTVLPPGAMSEETANAVAARMVRDAILVDAIADASGVSHEAWEAGAEFVLILDPGVTTPAAIAALRDVDLGLARSIEDQVQVSAAPIALPITTTSADRIDQVAGLSRLGLLLGLVATLSGAVLDRHRDRTIRAAAAALIVFGGVLIVAPLLARIPDLTSWGWRSASIVAAVDAAVVPLVVGGAVSVALGAFLRAVASQAAPTVSARIEQRERDAVTPPPAPTGAHSTRRRHRKVRQQGKDAFFGPEDDLFGPDDEASVEVAVADADEDAGAEPAPAHAESGTDATTSRPIPRPATGFDQAVDAVQAAPEGQRDTDVEEADDVGGEVEEISDAEKAAAERREALERVDGGRSRLRTHLPR